MAIRRKTLTREDWIAAARKVFVVSGIDDVKVDRLARKMKVTRGSFYWHFKNRKDLLDALLHDWEARNQWEIDQVRARWAAAVPNHAEIVRIWLAEDPSFPAFDMAVRVWARKAPRVAATVRRVDDNWINLLQIPFRDEGHDEIESFVRARVVYFHQIGYYALGIHEELEDRLRFAPYYHKILIGKPADAALETVIDEIRANHVRSTPQSKNIAIGEMAGHPACRTA